MIEKKINSKKMYEQCNFCAFNIDTFGQCKNGYDNYYYKCTKNNGCPKCQQTINKQIMLNNKLNVDVYFDLQCAKCGAYRSTDFEMGLAENKLYLEQMAEKEGWKNISGRNLCPSCIKEYLTNSSEVTLDENPLGKLNLPVRICNLLNREFHYPTIDDLQKISKQQLLETKGIGEHAILELIIALEQAGINVSWLKEG